MRKSGHDNIVDIILYDKDPTNDTYLWYEELKKIICDIGGYHLWYFKETPKNTDVTIAIAGLIDDDFFTHYPNITHIISLWAGVERFFKHPHLPNNIIIHRMLDPGLNASHVRIYYWSCDAYSFRIR